MPKKNAIKKVGYDLVTCGDSSGHVLKGDHLLDVEDVARILKCSVSILCKWRLAGRGPPFVRVGTLVRYRPADVQLFIAAGVSNSTSDGSPMSAK